MSDADRGVIGGRYQVIASLGKGGMGQVYKAYDPILDRTVALKKMIATVVDSEEGRQRFYIEARAAARLNHPNIVTIHELEEHGGDIYIVMELLDGVSLAAFMRQRVHMPLAGYLTIIAQIADGLHYAHKRAIVHRDIKPPNLVLTIGGDLKILDFGIARLASNEITKKGKLLGTPHYMAPEQVKEEAVDARADLFSLGAVAYELVTGIKPFAGDSVPALLMQITSTPHRPVLDVAPETDPALAAIIDRLLAKDRTARFGTGMDVVAALDLIGEVDRVDYVAEAVAAVMGPSGEATIYSPIGSTPIPARTPTPLTPTTPVTVTPPAGLTPPSVASSSVPPLFGATPSIPAGTPPSAPPPVDVTASDDLTPPFGVAPPPAVPPPSVPRMSVTPLVAPLPRTASPTTSTEEVTESLSAPAGSASADAPTLVDVEALATPEVSSPLRSVPLDTKAGAPPPLPEPAGAPPAAASPSPAVPASSVPSAVPPVPPASVPAPPSVMRSPAEGPNTPAAAAPPPVPAASAPAAGAKAAAPPAAAAPPRGFVSTGVPQARHRSGSGAAVVVIGLLLLPAVIATGWWAFNSMRGALQRGTTATDTTSTAAVKDADPSAQRPAEQQAAATTDQANPGQVDPNQKPAETPAIPPTDKPSQEPPSTPAVEANAATSTEKPQEGQASPRPADANAQTAEASRTSQPNSPPANQANASQLADARQTPPVSQPPANQPGANQADANRVAATPADARDVEPAREAVTDRRREVSPNTVVRDATRENTRREPAPPVRETPPPDEPARSAEPTREPAPSTPADTRSLDYGSLSAFRGGSRSTGSASNVYSDAPSTAAAVARITYALEAYGDAIAARDLDALRDVRSPISPAEATMLKEGRLTVRFSSLDVSLDGNDARVRCRRAVVAAGKTLSSGPADVRLTRRPEGWVITDIR